MTFAYRQYEVLPTPGQREGYVYRPVIPLTVRGPKGKVVVLGLLDTGSDVTVLPAFVLGLIGGKYNADEATRFRGVGDQVVTAHYGQVELGVQQYGDEYGWSAKVGFLENRHIAILGYSGFLEYFNATFNTERRRVTLRANKRLISKNTA